MSLDALQFCTLISEQQRKASSTEECDGTFPFQLVINSQQITNQINEKLLNAALKFPDPRHPDELDPESLVNR